MPDLEHKSSAAIAHGRSGPVGKGRMACNYHHCLTVILQSFISNQGRDGPIYATVQIGNYVGYCHVFFLLHLLVVMGLVAVNCVGGIRIKNYSPNIARLS